VRKPGKSGRLLRHVEMSASWANPVVKRLAEGDDIEGEYDGMLVVCSWPMPIAVQKQYEAFRKELEAVLPSQAYVYPASTLHCTVCTLRAFTAGKLTGDAITEAHKRWQVVLEAARASPDWPAGAFKLLMRAPSLEGAAGIFHYSDVDGAIEKMRTCIRAAIKEAGGLAAEGGKDRSKAKALPGSPAKDPAPHIPDIIHSTAVRWSADVPDKEKALSAFKAVADKWSPIEISVTAAAAVDESVPFMHIRRG
jgi:hypothetical protein